MGREKGGRDGRDRHGETWRRVKGKRDAGQNEEGRWHRRAGRRNRCWARGMQREPGGERKTEMAQSKQRQMESEVNGQRRCGRVGKRDRKRDGACWGEQQGTNGQ